MQVLICFLLIYGAYGINPVLALVALVLLIFKYRGLRRPLFISILMAGCLISVNNFSSPQDINYGIVIDTSDNYFLYREKCKTYYVYLENNNLEKGDIIKIEGKVEPLSFTSLESQFDFEGYLNSQNVFYEISNVKWNYVIKTPFRINAFKKYLLSQYDEKASILLSSLFFKEYNELSNKASQIGIYSFVTSSGMLMYSILSIFERIFCRFINSDKRKYLSYIFCFPLLLFSSFQVGVLRAYLISFNSKCLNNKIPRNSIYIVLLIFSVLVNPRYFLTTSFVMSFLLPYLFVYLSEAIKSFKKLNKNTVRTILISVLYLPYLIYINSQLSLFSFMFVLFFKSLFGIIFFISYILMFLPFLSGVTSFMMDFTNNIFEILSFFNLRLNFGYSSSVLTLVLYILYIISIMLFEIREMKKGCISLASIFIVSVLSSSEVQVKFQSFVAFINVGQGDCALIHDRNIDVLIDVGGSLKLDIALEVIYPYLQKKGIKDIDCVFLSHDDYDHAGSLNSLDSLLQIKEVILGSDFYQKSISNLTFYNLNHFGDGSFSNDDSSVLKLDFYSHSYLFTGDISTSIEQKLIASSDLSADILKIGHHGSKTSSSLSFLKKVNPEEAVISVGENNYYKHPSSEVINRLESLNIKIRRTDKEGTIVYHENNYLYKGIAFIYDPYKYLISI